MRPLRTPRVVVPVLAGLLACSMLAGCGGGEGDGGSAGPSASTTEAADPPADEIGRAAERCTEVLNARDASVFVAGRDASVRFLQLALADGPPDPAELDAVRADLAAVRDLLAADLATLTDAADLPEWDAVLAPVEDTIAVLDVRIAAADATWPPSPDDLRPGAAFAGADEEQVAAFFRRDCAGLATRPGPLPEAPVFAAAAAHACRVAVDRRRLGGFADDVDVVLDLVLAQLEAAGTEGADGADPTGADVAALSAVRDEWRRTYDDLAAVPTDDLGRVPGGPEAWEAVLALAQDRIAGYGARVEAIEGGDADAIAEALRPAALGAPGWDWTPLGLDGRDCAALSA